MHISPSIAMGFLLFRVAALPGKDVSQDGVPEGEFDFHLNSSFGLLLLIPISVTLAKDCYRRLSLSKFFCSALLFVVSSLTTLTASAAASNLGVVAYSMPDGAYQYGYNDNTYSGTNSSGFLSGGVGDLTDGVESASVSAGYFAWAPYVLWDGQSPVITFDLGVSSSVSEINTFFKYFPGAAVYIPESIGIRVSSNGTSFTSLNPRTFSVTELAPGGNDADGIYQLLSGPVTGRYFELTLNNQMNNRWLALSEVTFKGSVAPVPEPETYTMLLAGLGLIGAVVKRRKAEQI